VPLVLAGTAGIVVDRFFGVPVVLSLIVAVMFLVGWGAALAGKVPRLAVVYLWLAFAALAAAHHHRYCHVYPLDDIGHCTDVKGHPAQLRGVVDEEPRRRIPSPLDAPLRSFGAEDQTVLVLLATQLRRQDDWQPVSGRVRVTVSGRLDAVHIGDEVEAIGWLALPDRPSNPGEADFAQQLHDQRIRAVLRAHDVPNAVVRLAEGWPRSVHGWMAVLRSRCKKELETALPANESGLAIALLLGDGASLPREQWDRYTRTGVVHVLVISGQHLAVLAWFTWRVARSLHLRQRHGAIVVAAVLAGYTILVGGQPPVFRAVIMVCAFCGAILWRRPYHMGNTFALAWLAIGVWHPTDLCDPGCHLSFLGVATLVWGAAWWFRRPVDPLDQLIEESRPAWQRRLLGVGRPLGLSYGITLAVWLVLAPVLAARYHLVSPIAVVLTPPLVLLTSLALVFGFLFLLLAPWCGPLAAPFAWPVRWCLGLADDLVRLADRVPGGHWYVSDIPETWLWLVYPLLLALLVLPPLQRYWRWFALGGLAALCIGLLGGAAGRRTDELRCTFLAVGHGGCAVLETPDGRTLLYDAGAMTGPDVTRRVIAPYLWHRGIRRIDEVILSHADIDHFNGLPALLDRFAVGRITCTPTFATKGVSSVEYTLRAVHDRQVPIRVVKAGDVLAAGDVTLEVLHPPAEGPEGIENVRSLVLLVRHEQHTILLTGDIEGAGLARLLEGPPLRVDVLMAPHHGSRVANTPDLARWAQPRVVLSCQGAPRSPAGIQEPYSQMRVRFLTTWEYGAITVRSHQTGIVVETFRGPKGAERLVVR
jgi:competence protein ComEC